MNKKVEFIDWGLVDYQQAWDQQDALFNKTVAVKIQNRTDGTTLKTPNYLIFCEHPHVYTLGKSGHHENLLLDEAGLVEKEAVYYKINRGGDITYHGPGQLVGYPILDLDNFFTDIHLYLRTLEEAVILTLADYGINAGRSPGFTGVWLDADTFNARKICALGVRCSRWVTMHGFALNVNTNLEYFKNIVPCGIDDKDVTTMERELGHPLDMDEVKGRLKNHIAALFHMELETSVALSEPLHTYLALGDSYTIGEAVEKEFSFPYQLVSQLKAMGLNVAEPRIIAKTGWTTDELQHAITAEKLTGTYDLVTLLIGVNNQYRGYAQDTYRKEFKELLFTAIRLARGDTKRVFVVSIPDWGGTPFGKNIGKDPEIIGLEIDQFNAVNRAETLALGVSYIDITAASKLVNKDGELVAFDGLHPSGKMYKGWAAALSEPIVNLLK